MIFTYLFTMNPVLSLAAIIPAVVLMVNIYKRDKIEKEPAGLLISLVLLGALSTVFAAICETVGEAILSVFFTEGSFIYNFLLYFVVVAFSEELGKYILLKKRTRNSVHFNCRFDGVVYAVFVSLGFALWENIGYVASYGLSTALVRAVTAVPGHACFGVFMGAWYGLQKACENSGNLGIAKRAGRMAILVPVLLHGTYDFIATMKSVFSSAAFIVFVILMYIYALQKVKSISQNDYYIN